MELEILRTYYPKGTNGNLTADGVGVCHTIELPWKENEPQVSCIPEGRYELVKRYSPKFKWHIIVKDVPNRALILIHPANDALKELKGCIAPVSFLKGEGLGQNSKVVFTKLNKLLLSTFEKDEKVMLTIKSQQMKKIINRAKAPTPKFFKVLRNIGIALAAVSATLLTAPVALPAVLLSIAGYVGVAGSVMTAVSQLTVNKQN